MGFSVFLTGATGVVGSELLRQLLADQATEVSVLIRAKSDEHLYHRCSELCQKIGTDESLIGEQIHPIRGDISEASLGMTSEAYRWVADHCESIVHSAGNVRLNQSIEKARQCALSPAQEILHLAKQMPTLRKLDVVSTIGVAGRMEGVIPETRLGTNRHFHNTYEQAKSEAEELFWQAIEAGMPLSIHRPSMVVGDAVTGQVYAYQVFYHLCEFLSGRRTFGILPKLGEQMLDIVPVDFVASAIKQSMFGRDSVGRVFHLSTGIDPYLRVENIRSIVERLFAEFDIQCVDRFRPPNVTLQLAARVGSVVGPKPIRRSAKALPHLLAYLGRRQDFCSVETQAWLAKYGVVLPRPEAYLETVIRRYLTDKYSSHDNDTK
ncbi:SDR family oxidoreductase [Rhodopirellula sp. MGV]|uniref:SDR family oxidoreductase n=1 Tax=Rhodopirellula sp. MGV TaxID=2023130 RepID=UPI000B96BDC0|nr:SDR family oxidoreductase [Rhodopirellula sp. MGV]OYP32998.1 hypothetical protein CGZ80_19105 [Rhodopirellula sp. MGV]